MSTLPDPHPAVASVHALQPLAVLEALQQLDAHVPDELDELHDDLVGKRLGASRTVAAQVERYAGLMRDARRVPVTELTALLRLVVRRRDAGLVFTDAGRRAGRHAVRGLPAPARTTHGVLPGSLRNAVGFRMARQRAGRVFGATLDREPGTPRAMMAHAPSADVSDGACAFYGATFAEMLRLLTDFDGAMLHVRCRARGDEACVWGAAEETT